MFIDYFFLVSARLLLSEKGQKNNGAHNGHFFVIYQKKTN